MAHLLVPVDAFVILAVAVVAAVVLYIPITYLLPLVLATVLK
jgi:hypothetical protein